MAFLRHFTFGDPHWYLMAKVSRLCQWWNVCASRRRAFTSLRICLSWRLTYGSQIARHTCGCWSGMGHTESRPILWLCTVLSLSGWLFRSWQSFYNLIGVDTFWSHALRHSGSLSAFCFSPMPPLGYLTACGAWLAPALFIHVHTCSGSCYKSPC